VKYNAAGRPVLDLGLGEFDITFLDNVVLYFGTGNDLGIFHDGTDSYIENATGGLHIDTDRSGEVIVGMTAAEVAASWFSGAAAGSLSAFEELTLFNIGGAGRINSMRVNGSLTSPTALTSGNNLFSMKGWGWDSSVPETGTEIRGVAAENWSSTVHGARLQFMTTEVGATGVAERVRIFTNGAQAVDGAVGTPAYSFLNDTDCGMYRIGTNNIGIGVAGANVLNIATTGLAVTGTLSASGLITALSHLDIQNSSDPRLTFYDSSGAAANEAKWQFRTANNGNVFRLYTVDDADALGTVAVQITRSGTSVTEVELNATTFDFNGTLDVDGVNHDISTSGTFTISGTGETLATFVDDGACTFYHNNTSRIATSATGVDMVAGTFRLFGYTVAGLAALTPNVGETAYVTDALAPAYGVAAVGGGAVVVPVFYNGAAWITA